ncbi:uncharacterized protein ARMOST_21033 [Armillaria ostoyae]|uniref:Uncharacterized protein n=1 Tax=Armillaria ostoyae TaxID=47428 RepID=A0A284S8Z3_ARMOS|nr:uncharacterized protein ARMOST_21033 [Armillaria ostoyae]
MSFRDSPSSYMRLCYSAQPSMMGQQRIPPEIWQEIFVHCLPDLQEVRYYSTSDLVPHPPSKSDAPLLLLLVCRTWRYWALRTPRLWARLSVAVNWGKSYPPVPEALAWLKRSKSAPLTFSFRQNGDWIADHITASEFLQQFLQHIHRWQHASLHLGGAFALSALAKHNAVVPRELRSMYLSLVAPTEVLAMTDEFSSVLNHFTSAPNFSSLVISGVNVFQCLEDHRLIQWERLTEIKLDDVNYIGTCLALFSMCKNLVRCTMGVLDTGYPSASEHLLHPPPGIITLPNLTALRLNVNDTDICRLFSQLHVPELHELAIYSSSQTWPQAVFSSWLERSKCALTRVEFRDTRMRQEQFLQCLRLASFATVTELVMNEEGWLPEDWSGLISRDAIEALTVREDKGGCLLPKLQSLDLSGRCVEEDSGAAVIKMIASRCHADGNGVERFRKISWSMVAEYDYLEAGDLDTLKALENRGLEANVTGAAAWWC